MTLHNEKINMPKFNNGNKINDYKLKIFFFEVLVE